MKKIAPKDIDKNVIKLIGQDWMLVTAGDQEKFNMMTASWGSMGYLWNKPVVMVFVRPQRYTFEFTEKKDEFTLSFFDEKYRHALNVCGSVSGRDVNKVQELSLIHISSCESGKCGIIGCYQQVVHRCRGGRGV